MIDPTPGTADYPLLVNGSDIELQRFLMLGPFVTGKTAAQQQPKLNAFVTDLLSFGVELPFDALKILSEEETRGLLEKHRSGQYTRITRAMREMAEADLDLRTCTREDLIKIHGISMKSASFFLVYTQDADYAVWDVHLLRWAREDMSFWFKGMDVPRQTPGKKCYLELEQKFLEFLPHRPKKTPRD